MGVKERTSKTQRILERSNIQVAIVFASRFVRRNWRKAVCFPRLTICCWIRGIVLGLSAWSVNRRAHASPAELTHLTTQLPQGRVD